MSQHLSSLLWHCLMTHRCLEGAASGFLLEEDLLLAPISKQQWLLLKRNSNQC